MSPTVSRPWDDAKWTAEIGRVDELIRKYGDARGINQNGMGYLGGQPEMIEHGKRGLAHRLTRW